MVEQAEMSNDVRENSQLGKISNDLGEHWNDKGVSDWTQQQIADEVGCSQPYVAQVISKKYESYNLVIPEHVKSKSDKADFRKLPYELQEQVRANYACERNLDSAASISNLQITSTLVI